MQAAAPGVPQSGPIPAQEALAGAEARYRSAIALNPSIAAYHESLALVLERKGNTAEALAEHQRAVALDSLSSRNRLGLGSLLLQLGRPKDAAIHLRAAAAADPQAIPVRIKLAKALAADTRLSEAGAVLDSARAIAPNDSSIALAQTELGSAVGATEGYHDLSAFADDERSGRWVRVLIERFFATVLGIAALVLLAPMAGALLALIVEVPRQWLARRA